MDSSNVVFRFIRDLHACTKSHLNWVCVPIEQRNLRSMPHHNLMIVRELFDLDSHKSCKFGRWFRTTYELFHEIDEDRAEQLKKDHYDMHELARIYYSNPDGNVAYYNRLRDKQEAVVAHLAYFDSNDEKLRLLKKEALCE